jgi:hypothetical protein
MLRRRRAPDVPFGAATGSTKARVLARHSVCDLFVALDRETLMSWLSVPQG